MLALVSKANFNHHTIDMKDKDYAMLFEGVVIKFFGAPEDEIYYANYYENDFTRQAILYSICVKERHSNTNANSQKQLKILDEFIGILSNSNAKQNDMIKCIEFLLAKT